MQIWTILDNDGVELGRMHRQISDRARSVVFPMIDPARPLKARFGMPTPEDMAAALEHRAPPSFTEALIELVFTVDHAAMTAICETPELIPWDDPCFERAKQ